ncbi:MAG TPA: hypothetical protein VIH59_19110 [Candidatus Tectomicrobia bacterium]|jgi:hypothetical protein
MQVRCNVYGLIHASSGIECLVEQDLLEVGGYVHYKDQDYVIVSVVESQGRWFANVVPEGQQPLRRWHPALPRPQVSAEEREPVETWRQRLDHTERKMQELHEEREHFGARLDRLMQMLELLTKDPEGPQH